MSSELDLLLSAIDNSEKTNLSFRKFNSNEETKRKLRLLPALESKGEKLPFVKHRVHFLNGKAFYCLNQDLTDKNHEEHQATTCPICEKASQLWNKGVEKSRESEECQTAKKLFAKDNYYYRAICREDDNPTIPDVWQVPKGIHDSIIEVLRGREKGNIFSLTDGRDVIIKKSGKGKTSSYFFDTADTSQIFTDKEKIKKTLELLKNVEYSKIVEFKTTKEVKDALDNFLGILDEEEFESKPDLKASSTKDVFKEIEKSSKKIEVKEVIVEEDEETMDLDDLINSL